MGCPNCGSHNIQVVNQVTTKGFGAGKGCLGYLLLGPLGLLCSLCGMGETKTTSSEYAPVAAPSSSEKHALRGRGSMDCPKCKSSNTSMGNVVETEQFNPNLGLLGAFTFSIPGVLCGFCTMEQKERLMWVCGECGAHFK